MEVDRLEKLRQQREKIAARIRREEAKQRDKERKTDTRRKILAGALVLERAESDPAFKTELYQWLGRFLVRDDDRALFGFDALPSSIDNADTTASAEPAERVAS